MSIRVPKTIIANSGKSAERVAWLEHLPATIEELQREWSLEVGPSFEGAEITASFVAPAQRADGTCAVLKVGMPHFEALQEIDGLRFWSGDPTVHLLAANTERNAMLLERCETGTSLRELPEPEQGTIIATLLRRLWRKPSTPHRFRPLAALTDYWSQETLAQQNNWPDKDLIREALHLFHALPRSATTEVLLATDLHAGNVLRARREPWLVIDPKPFVGDPAYDATQHLFNCFERLRSNPRDMIHRIADLLELDAERVRLWTFARAAAEPRVDWHHEPTLQLARALAR